MSNGNVRGSEFCRCRTASKERYEYEIDEMIRKTAKKITSDDTQKFETSRGGVGGAGA